MLPAVRFAVIVILAGCVTTTRATMSPATAKLECLDCDQPIAVGIPVRLVSSWVGSCTKEGYTSFFEFDDDDQIRWRRTSFNTTKECDEHHYKIAVKCTSECVIRAIDSPDTSTVKLLGVYPKTPGPLKFSVEIRSSSGDVVAQFASAELLVRAPDDVAPMATERAIDDASPLAVFAGYEYFLDPATARAGKSPTRGTKYKPEEPPPVPEAAEQSTPEQPTRLTRACRARTPGALTWRPCTQGIQEGDDVRLDVTAWFGTVRMFGDVSLVELPDAAWTCYRATFVPGGQICMRYGIPAGEHPLTWKGLGWDINDKLVVGGGS